ncbi:Glucose dehydrogenase [FAD, quinone] [Orchesella cincta]|uniref:Glucose dehydrogenase [FAD, quinone] n=1 Tax=Orchesella cincta TaxID=48709 RepID=A0A1D2M865_ORCCI|nr:Glucose dehydrogenase [FAD, quinone] [Orchesella cincta]
MNVMLEGIQTVLRLYENTTTLGGKLVLVYRPGIFLGCEQHDHRSRNYWECVTRTLTGTLYHPSSTCSMGKPGDPGTVGFLIESCRNKRAESSRFLNNAKTCQVSQTKISKPKNQMLHASY